MRLTTLILTVAFLIAGCAAKETTKTETTTKVAEKTEKVKSDVQKAAKKDKAAVVEETKEATTEVKDTAKTTTASVAGNVVCKSGGDERTIATAKSESGGCEVQYTKNGQTNSVANSQTGDEYCHGVVGKIKGNLEAAGFTCNEG